MYIPAWVIVIFIILYFLNREGTEKDKGDFFKSLFYIFLFCVVACLLFLVGFLIYKYITLSHIKYALGSLGIIWLAYEALARILFAVYRYRKLPPPKWVMNHAIDREEYKLKEKEEEKEYTKKYGSFSKRLLRRLLIAATTILITILILFLYFYLTKNR